MSIRWENNLDLSRLLRAIDEAEPEALAEGMEHVRGVSDEQTPIETGRLVGGATVEVDVEQHQASLSYPGPYARAQHERLDYRHEHGNAKFEENALRSEGRTAIDIIAKRIERSL